MIRRTAVIVVSLFFTVLLVRRYVSLGGPYFEMPETIQDHVNGTRYPSRDAIVMSNRAARILPRGATVTVIMPSQAPDFDPTLYYLAAGLLPHNHVVGPDLRIDRPQYVLTVREPLTDTNYVLTQQFPEGSIYKRR